MAAARRQRATDPLGDSVAANPDDGIDSGRYTSDAGSEEFLASLEDRESLTDDLGSLVETLDIQRDAELVESLRVSLREAEEQKHLPLPDEF